MPSARSRVGQGGVILLSTVVAGISEGVDPLEALINKMLKKLEALK